MMNNRFFVFPVHALFFMVFTSSLFLALGSLPGQEVDHWGPCEAIPAVVHPATLSENASVLSLRGEWDFVTDSGLMGRHRMGKGPLDWNEPDWSGVHPIQVPSCWEAQGVGDPGMSLPWDPVFDNNQRPLRHIWTGVARYRKTVTLPTEWTGKQIWLAIGGVKAEGYFWVNKRRVAWVQNYCGTYKYNITDYVKPGEPVEIVATVRNDTPSRKGLMSACHRWGGLYRDVELQATPDTRLDDVWVRGDIETRTAEVHVTATSVDPQIQNATVAVAIKDRGGKTIISSDKTTIPVGTEATIALSEPSLQLWSPESPNLYLAEVTLFDPQGKQIHGWTERFGLRRLEVKGRQFYLNGKPYFLRGYGDDYIYPLTLASPPDLEEHLRHMQLIKRAGFNYVRLHTHNELPEFYEAADEAGILVQPELPYYHDITTEGFVFDPMRDLQELYRHFRRYVSFACYCTGNEGFLGQGIDVDLYQWAKTNDPDRLMQHQDGGCNQPENSDFDSPNGYHGPSSIVPWPVGAFAHYECPFVAHEYLNLGIKMDPRLEERFTGVMVCPRSLKDYDASLERVGLDRDWGDRTLNSAHGLQAYYQKRGIEQARLDPDCDGFDYWTLVDVMVRQGSTYTGQGMFNAFYDQKDGGLSPEEVAEFNSPTVIIACGTPGDDVLVSGTEWKLDFHVSQYDASDFPAGTLLWSIDTENGKNLGKGQAATPAMPSGFVALAGSDTFVVPDLEHPTAVTLTVKLAGTSVVNHWKKWFFPKREPRSLDHALVSPALLEVMKSRYTQVREYGSDSMEPSDILVATPAEDCVKQALAEGRSVLLVGPAEGCPNIQLGWWSLGSQLGTAFAKHAAFGDFPQSGRLDPLWFRLIRGGMFDLSQPNPLGHLEPLVVGEGVDTYYLYLGETNKGTSRILASWGISLLEDVPEAAWLLDNLIQYMAGIPTSNERTSDR